MPALQWLWVALLTLVGLALLFVEVFLPSFGVLTALALGAMATALYLVYAAYGAPGAVVAGVIVLVVALVELVAAFRLLPRSPLMLRSPPPEPDATGDLVGGTGVAETPLRPAGKVRVDGRLLDAEAEGELIEAGARVRVIAMRPGRVVVRRAKRNNSNADER